MLNHIIVTTRPIIIEEPLVSPAHKRNIYYKSCDFLFLLFAGNKIDVGDQCFQTLILLFLFSFLLYMYALLAQHNLTANIVRIHTLLPSL